MMVPGSQQLSEFIGLKVDPLDATVLSKYDLFSEIQNDFLYDKGLQSTNEGMVRLYLAKIFKLQGMIYLIII